MKKLLTLSIGLLLSTSAFATNATRLEYLPAKAAVVATNTHPCTTFSHSVEKISPTKTLFELLPLIAAASAKDASRLSVTLITLSGFADTLVQTSVSELMAHDTFFANSARFFSNRWVSLSTAAVVYLYAKNVLKMENPAAILEMMLIAVYGQNATALLLSEMDKCDSIN